MAPDPPTPEATPTAAPQTRLRGEHPRPANEAYHMVFNPNSIALARFPSFNNSSKTFPPVDPLSITTSTRRDCHKWLVLLGEWWRGLELRAGLVGELTEVEKAQILEGVFGDHRTWWGDLEDKSDFEKIKSQFSKDFGLTPFKAVMAARQEIESKGKGAGIIPRLSHLVNTFTSYGLSTSKDDGMLGLCSGSIYADMDPLWTAQMETFFLSNSSSSSSSVVASPKGLIDHFNKCKESNALQGNGEKRSGNNVVAKATVSAMEVEHGGENEVVSKETEVKVAGGKGNGGGNGRSSRNGNKNKDKKKKEEQEMAAMTAKLEVASMTAATPIATPPPQHQQQLPQSVHQQTSPLFHPAQPPTWVHPQPYQGPSHPSPQPQHVNTYGSKYSFPPDSFQFPLQYPQSGNGQAR